MGFGRPDAEWQESIDDMFGDSEETMKEALALPIFKKNDPEVSM